MRYIPIIVIVCLCAVAPAGAAGYFKVDGNALEVTTASCTARFEKGALVRLVNRKTKTDYMAAPVESRDASTSGLINGLQTLQGAEEPAKEFAKQWWAAIDGKNAAVHRPATDGRVEITLPDARHARMTVTGLAQGGKAFPEERLVLDVAVIAPQDDIEVRMTASSPDPGVFGVTFGTLGWRKEMNVITADMDGKEFTHSNSGASRNEVTEWPTFWRFPLVIGRIPGQQGCCLLWSEDTDYRALHLFTTRDAAQTNMGFDTQNLPPFKDSKEARSVAWRITAFPGDWRQAADHYRATLIAHGLLKDDRPAWTKDICAIYLGSHPNKATIDALAAGFPPEAAKRLLFHAQGWRKAGFDNNLWDYTPYDNFAADIDYAHTKGFRVMAYMQPMYCRWKTLPGTEDPATIEFNDVYSFKDPFTGKGWGSMHLGLDAYRTWFEGKAEELTRAQKVDAIYLDSSHSARNSGHGLLNGKTTYQGMTAFCAELRAQHPALAFASEGEQSLNAALVSWAITAGRVWGDGTGEGELAMAISRTAHPLETYLLRDYLYPYVHNITINQQVGFHIEEDYAERRGAMASLGALPGSDAAYLPEGRLNLYKAQLFASRGLRPYFPAKMDPAVRSYFRAADGTVFRYQNEPYGSSLIESEGKQARMYYARIHGVTECRLPAGMNVPGWIGRNADGLIGLQPLVYYCAFREEAAQSPVEIRSLPDKVYIREIRSAPEGVTVRLEQVKDGPAQAQITVALAKPLARLALPTGDLPGPIPAGTRTLTVALPATLIFQLAESKEIAFPYSLVRKPGEQPRVSVMGRNGLPTFPTDQPALAQRHASHGTQYDNITKKPMPGIREAMGYFNKLVYQDYWLKLPAQPAKLVFLPRVSREFKEARMVVMVDGKNLWEGKDLYANPLKEEVTVELAPYAGKEVLLTLYTDTARHSDFFLWLNPRIEAKG